VLGFCTVAACLASAAAPNPARAESLPPPLVAGATVPWHASLADARQAALVSRRPVLVVFTAGMTESGAALVRDVFPAAETVALLTAGFEPVCVDVDIDPTTGRRFGVGTVPTACILDAQERLVARFECPTVPAAFVAAVSRASQEAAAAQSTGSVKAVAAMREQSDFAAQPAAGASMAPGPWPAPTQPEPTAVDEPALPATPPAWPAEPATRPMPQASAPAASVAARPSLEPAAASAASAAATPWIDSKPSLEAKSAVETQPASALQAATVPTATPAPEEKKPSASESFIAALKKPFTIFSQPKQPDAKAVPTDATAAAAAAGGPVAAADANPMPLGLEGYCPVSLVDKGTWVEGRAQWGARHRGRTYLFAGAEQQRAFLADPDRYAPALSGDDPVLACDSGRQVAGQRRFGVSYQSRTYLFSSPETRAAFAADPQRYTTRVTLAERPMAPGTLVR